MNMSLSKLRWQGIVGLSLMLGVLVGPTPAATNGTQRVIIYSGPGVAIDQLQKQGITQIANYGGYWVAQVTAQQQADLQKTLGNQIRSASNFNRIELQTSTLDTLAPERDVPSALRQTVAATGQYLRLIQFKGPVLSGWLKAVTAIHGVKVVSYIPNNAYIVSTDASGETQLRRLVEPAGPIQWIGAYHPAYKIQQGLLPAGGANAALTIRVVILDGPEAATTIAAIRRYSAGNISEPFVQHNRQTLQLSVYQADMAAIAQLPNVLWMERVVSKETKDEKQDLILAGRVSQLPGHSPIPANSGGERYLDFLYNNVGGGLTAFTNSATYPVVDIADTGFEFGSTYPAHPDFYEFGDPTRSSRVISVTAAGYPNGSACFPAHNFPYGADFCGHGTFVASIIAGYNNTPSNFVQTCYEYFEQCICVGPSSNAVCSTQLVTFTNTFTQAAVDNDGFQLGLGVSPFGLIGATRIFDQLLAFSCDPFNLSAGCGFFCASSLPVLVAQEYVFNQARIVNNSWGDVLATDPAGHFSNAGAYTLDCQSYDSAVRDVLLTGTSATPGPSPLNQEFIVVFAGGNAGSGGNVGGFGDVLMTAPATAKNIIAVGATENVRLNGDGCLTTGEQDNSYDISGFSSFGPTLDGRFKPEIVAPGSSIYGATDLLAFDEVITSCKNDGKGNPAVTCDVVPGIQQCTSLYYCESGTSFAAPAVSGGIQLLWWYFQNRLNMLAPSPAMAKAYLCNSARYLPVVDKMTGVKDTLPSIGQGMGMMDLSRMFDGVPRVLRDESTPRAIDLPLITTNPVVQQTFFSQSGQSYVVSGRVYDQTKPFRVTLAWTDAPGDPAAFKQLVNDLDLQVTVNGKAYKGNVFAEDHSVTGGAYDDVNNMESVFLPAGQTGTWTVVVRAANIAGNGVPNIVTPNGTNTVFGQDFALVVYNAKPSNPAPSDVSTLTTNDTCTTAIEIHNFPYTFSNQLNRAVYANTMPSPSAGRGGIKEFFKIVVPDAGSQIFVDTFGSDFDTLLSVWQVQVLPQTVNVRGECGALVEVTSNNDVPADYANACNAEGNKFLQAAVTWIADGSNTYYVVAEPFNDNIPAGKGNLHLNVCGSAPNIRFDPPNAYDFGHVLIFTNSSSYAVNLTNGTANPFNVLSVTLAGDNPGDFKILEEQCKDQWLSPQHACSMLVEFDPTAPGLRTAKLVVEYVISTGAQSQTLLLSGTGDAAQPQICVSGTAVTFPSTTVGFSTNLSVVVTNCGTLALSLNTSITGAGAADFQIVPPACPTIAPGTYCALTIQFNPTTNGTRTAALNLSGVGATSQTVSLTGPATKTVPLVCLPSKLNFGSVALGASASQSVSITNCGTAPLSIGTNSWGGANAARFAILPGDGCSNHSLVPGDSCSFTVAYTPTAVGSASATLMINDNAANSPQSISLAGTCVNNQPDASISSKLTAKSFMGLGTNNTTGVGQEIKQPVTRGKTCVFYVLCKNAGSYIDRYTVSGAGDGAGYTVQYFLGPVVHGDSGVDITRAVENGQYLMTALGAGASTSTSSMLRIVVTADKTAAKGTTSSLLVTFTSGVDATKSDTVKATFTIK